MKQLSDWELIQRSRKGSDEAFAEILQRYERLVYSIALRYGLTRDDATDVAQQTFMLMIAQLDRFHEDSNLKGWCGTVTRRHSWRLLNRYDHEQVERPEDLVELSDRVGARFEVDPDNAFVVEWLHEGMASLAERCRKLIHALYFDAGDPSYDDISLDMGISKGSIGPTRQRCLNKLRTLLEVEDMVSAEI